MKKLMLLIITTLFICCSQEEDTIFLEQKELYENIVSFCSENNCPNEVVCFYSNDDLYYALYIYNEEYYEVIWSIKENEYIHNDFALTKEQTKGCVE